MGRNFILESVTNFSRNRTKLKKTAFLDQEGGIWEETTFEDYLTTSYSYYEILKDNNILNTKILVFSHLLLTTYFIDYANYFCKNIPEEVFAKRLRRLERTLDTLNSRKNFRVFLSREGFHRMKEKGLGRTARKVVRFARAALRPI